jgi:hypothetical protein
MARPLSIAVGKGPARDHPVRLTPFHFAEAAANVLTHAALGPVAKSPRARSAQ